MNATIDVGSARPAATTRRRWSRPGIVVAAGVLLVLAFGPAAHVVAGTQPRPPARLEVVDLDAAPKRPTVSVRDLPAGAEGNLARTPGQVRALAERLLGTAGAARLVTLLQPGADSVAETAVGGRLGFAPYPYRYPALTSLLDGAPRPADPKAATALGAALVQVSAQGNGDGSPLFRNAAPAAFAVLDRARRDGDCLAQLDLLLLVAADGQPRDAVVRSEAARATAACPNDPTPGWVLGEYQSQRAVLIASGDEPGDRVPADMQAQAMVTLTALAARFPRSADALAAAADGRLRAGLRLAAAQPFTARDELRAALAGYRRAYAVAGDRPADPLIGMARALIGLGRPADAAGLLRRALTAGPSRGPVLALLVEAQEAAHDFSGAQATAQRLTAAGTSSYPGGPSLFAFHGWPYATQEQPVPDPQGPMSTGLVRSLPFTVDLQPGPGGANAEVEDGSFVPQYRWDPGYAGTDASCPSWAWRRDAVLAGRAAAALTSLEGLDPLALPPWFTEIRPGRQDLSCGVNYASDDFRDVVRLEAGGTITAAPARRDTLEDHRQNMWRWAGNLPRARTVVQAWLAQSAPADALPMLRLAEVDFLRHSYDDAAAEFGAAARRVQLTTWNDDVSRDQALLARGAALLAAGRHAEGTTLLREVVTESERGSDYQLGQKNSQPATRFAVIAFHARALLADDERTGGALRASVEDYDAARELVPTLQAGYAIDYKPARVDANRAISLLAIKRVSDARTAIDQALATDPHSPAFLMTAGYVAERAGDTRTAVREDALALGSDPGAFPAANDLGVLLARAHRNGAAVTAFQKAIGARPDYALAWFNLGVTYARMGPQHLLASQGCLARAISLDPALREAKPELTIDARTYRTGLDLSRPLPSGWSLATAERRAPAASAGLLAVVLLGLALARSSAAGSTDTWAERWLASVSTALGRLRWLERLQHPAWALGVTVLVLLLPALRHPDAGPWAIAALAVGVLVAGGAALHVRRVVALQEHAELHQRSWGPGMAVGLAGSLVGAPLAPLPVVRGETATPRVHGAAPAALALLGVVLFVETAWLGVPLTRSLAVAVLVMTASLLLPVEPLDGAHLDRGNLLVGAGVIAAATLVGLGFF